MQDRFPDENRTKVSLQTDVADSSVSTLSRIVSLLKHMAAKNHGKPHGTPQDPALPCRRAKRTLGPQRWLAAGNNTIGSCLC